MLAHDHSPENIPYHFKIGSPRLFKNCMVCPPATSEAGPRRPRSSAYYSDSSTKIVVTNLLTVLTSGPHD
jgi:hypothetical protein